MSLPIYLRPEAARDSEEARDHLDTLHRGRGAVFLSRLDETLRRIGSMPDLYGVVWRDVRAAPLRQSQYVAYYRVLADRVEVLAVMHGSRGAPAWQGRA